jgi:hypothetical protein
MRRAHCKDSSGEKLTNTDKGIHNKNASDPLSSIQIFRKNPIRATLGGG